MSQKENKILGTYFGVHITPRDGHEPLMEFLIEDDGNWLDYHDFVLSVLWIDDVLEVLNKARLELISNRIIKS